MEIEAKNPPGTYDIPLPGGICPDCFEDKRQTKVYHSEKLGGRLVVSYCTHHKTGGTIVLGTARPRWMMMSPLTREEFLEAAIEFGIQDVTGANTVN